MPDITLLWAALAAAGLTAAAALLALATRRPGTVAAASAVALAPALGLGCWVVGYRPNWPPHVDQDRFLLLLFPATVLVEAAAALAPSGFRVWWPLRLGIAGAAGYVLLHGSVYVTELAGPGSREWSVGTAILILGGLALALAASWAALVRLAGRERGICVPLTLAGTCMGAGVTLMLSGYATGGQMGLVLAAALLGASAVVSFADASRGSAALVGPAVVGLFALLITGHFFGKLTPTHGALLFTAPLLGWLVQLPAARRRAWVQVPAWLLLAAVPVDFAVMNAKSVFDASERLSTPGGSSLGDYLDYGK